MERHPQAQTLQANYMRRLSLVIQDFLSWITNLEFPQSLHP
jgi:hypothetical protein